MQNRAVFRKKNIWFKRIGWFGLLWLAGILCLGIIALFLQMLMTFAGLTT